MGQFAPAPCRGDGAAPDIVSLTLRAEGGMEDHLAIDNTSEKGSNGSSFRQDPNGSRGRPLEQPSSRQTSKSSASTDTSPKRISGSETLSLFNLEKHYNIGPKLGQGAYGSVYSVTDVHTGRPFALKTVVKTQGQGSGDIEAEIASSSLLDHPYIVKLHAFFWENNAYHVVMELCTGGDLMTVVTEHVRRARKTDRRYNSGLPSKNAGRYAWQMLNGLEFLHRTGLIHRDIKPENYLLQDDTPNSPLKLTDFGFTCHIGPEQKLTRSVGSAYYAAPELLGGSYDQAADVWSLGITCFWMCTNMLPFGGFDEKEYLTNVKAGVIEQYDSTWKQHLPSMREMVLQMLIRDPQARPSPKKLVADNTWLKAYDRQAGANGCCVIA